VVHNIPDHLFTSPTAPTTTYQATQTKSEDYDSDNTLVDSDDEGDMKPMKAQSVQLEDGAEWSAFDLDKLIMQAQTINHATI
jgi:hypothetical protein